MYSARCTDVLGSLPLVPIEFVLVAAPLGCNRVGIAILEDVLRGYVDIKMKVKPRAALANGNGNGGH